ncbi:MAG: M14 family metallopeptidase [Rikenellaceae bacterium]
MKKEILYTMKSPYRDDFKIYGYRFGEGGKKSVAVVGAIRGDELQQQYTCAQLVKAFKELEEAGALTPEYEVLIIPSVNPYSMNIGKRFWSMDNTDINRMFPGYDKGETTQRIAAALFESIKDFEFGIQLASYYLPGEFIPHVRMLKTGYEPEHEAKHFGFPYVYVREVAPYDTAMLNYNWQIWETKAFSVYTGRTDKVNSANVDEALEALLRFMINIGVVNSSIRPGYRAQTITDANLVTIPSPKAGLIRRFKRAQESVRKGDLLAEIMDPYEATVLAEITAPVSGVVFFNHAEPLILEGARAFQIVEDLMV